MRVLILSRTPETGAVGAIYPFPKGIEPRENQRAWHRPGEDAHGWMRPLSFPSSTTIGAGPEPRSTAEPIAYRGEAQAAVGQRRLAECPVGIECPPQAMMLSLQRPLRASSFASILHLNSHERL